jgi:uncharacterized protein (DUF1778 family)
MSSNPRRREHPLSTRLPEADIAVIDRAAARAAEAALLEDGPVRMTAEGFAAFLAAISAPAAAPPEMVAILKRRAPWDPTRDEGYLASMLSAPNR